MDFLGVGIPELFVILILALIFIGPRDLPKLAARLGRYVRQLQLMSADFRAEWRRELAQAGHEDLLEIKDEILSAGQAIREAGQEISSVSRDVKQEMKSAGDDVSAEVKEASEAAKSVKTIAEEQLEEEAESESDADDAQTTTVKTIAESEDDTGSPPGEAETTGAAENGSEAKVNGTAKVVPPSIEANETDEINSSAQDEVTSSGNSADEDTSMQEVEEVIAEEAGIDLPETQLEPATMGAEDVDDISQRTIAPPEHNQIPPSTVEEPQIKTLNEEPSVVASETAEPPLVDDIPNQE